MARIGALLRLNEIQSDRKMFLKRSNEKQFSEREEEIRMKEDENKMRKMRGETTPLAVSSVLFFPILKTFKTWVWSVSRS